MNRSKHLDFRLGISPLSWVNEVIEEFGRHTSAETVLSQAAAAGYAGVEMSRVFPKDAGQLKPLLAGYGLDLISGWHSGFLAERDVEAELAAVHDHAQLLAECGASVMVYGECGLMAENALDIPMSRRLRLGQGAVAGYCDRLTGFAETLASRYGLELAYHHHLMMIAETVDEVETIIGGTGDAVGLLLDTGHCQAGGFDYRQLIQKFGGRINHIHLKDVRAEVIATVRDQDLSFNQAVRSGVFTIPGDGMVKFDPIIEFARETGYSGWMVVEAEQDPNHAPPRKPSHGHADI